jgi:hypothetical protein
MCGGGGGGDVFQSIGDTLASIDPGPAIGDVGASIDSAVNQVPGGWYTVGALGAGGAGIAFAPEIAAAAGIGADTAITSELGQQAFFDALANGAASTDAINAGLAADAAAASAGAGVGGVATDTTSSLPSLTDPSLTTQIGAPSTSTGGFGTITAPATGSGAIPGAGATTLPGGGLTGALPAGTIVGDGTAGTAFGQLYNAAGPGQFALDAFGNAIPYSSVGLGGIAPETGLSLSDLNNARKAAQLANSLLSSSGSGSGSTSSKQFLSPTSGTSTLGDAANASSSSSAYGSPKGTFVHGQQVAIPGMLPDYLPTQANTPTPNVTPLDLQLIQQARAGGIIHKASGGDLPMHEVRMRGKQFTTYQPHSGLSLVPHLASGGAIPEGHNPTFFSQGGLNSMENTYVKGDGDGTSDSVAAMLANGEFVIPADIVSKLGNGSNDAGAEVLDNFLVTIREHAQKHDPKDLPPKSKGALAYLLDANKKVRA